MSSQYVIKREVDCDGQPVHEMSQYWVGQRGGGWGWVGNAQVYATPKLAAAALKRNGKYDYTFRRGYARIAEVQA